MSLRDDINIPVVVALGLVTGLIVAVAIVGTQAGYNYVSQAELERNYAQAETPTEAMPYGTLSVGKRVWGPQEAALKKGGAWATTQRSLQTLSLEDAKQLMIQSKGAASVAAK